jgi:undecaprenyl-diphosphatase
MNAFEALILGLVQGLTEYLPVSSSGHLAIGSALFGINGEENLTFTIAVHVATVLSTLVILWKEIKWIFKGMFKFEMNDETRYALNIVISMIPIGIVGVFFKDKVEEIFGSGLLIVGCMLLVTALLLAFSYYAKPRQREKITPLDALIIGIAQACAVMPGLSRSGSTIATGLLLGNKKERLAQFSFLMVIPPILGEPLLDIVIDIVKAMKNGTEAAVGDIVIDIVKAMKNGTEAAVGDISLTSVAIGFVAAFIAGCVACKWMINIVKRGKLVYFAIYCAIVGAITIATSL